MDNAARRARISTGALAGSLLTSLALYSMIDGPPEAFWRWVWLPIAALVPAALVAVMLWRAGQRDAWTTRLGVAGAVVGAVLGVLAGIGVGWTLGGDTGRKLAKTLGLVLAAVGISGGIWVAANLIFNQARHHWLRFSVLSYAVLGLLAGVLLSGNRITSGSEGGFWQWVWLPLLLAAAFAVWAAVRSATSGSVRQVVSIGGALATGLLISVLVRERYLPELDHVKLVVLVVVVGGLGAGLSVLRRRDPVDGALVGMAIGWALGGWGGADLGDGDRIGALVATLVPAALVGLRLARRPAPALVERAELEQRSRAVIFLAPGLLFIFATLVIPTIRTIYISLLDRDAEEYVGLDNYRTVFTDEQSWDASNWTNMFTSRLMWIGVVLLVVGGLVGSVTKKRTGRLVELGSPSMAPIVGGGMFVLFAVFTAVRGTISNNLWWVVTVTLLSTSLGLAIAVLADNARFEKAAKSIIFMPMAVSLVGASVIWRFMYVSRDVSKEQTGVMNASWVSLGKLSTGSGLPTIIVGVLLVLGLVGLLVLLARALVREQWAKAVVPGVSALLLGWFALRYWGLFGTTGVGGFQDKNGRIVGDTIEFVQGQPFNSMWLMVILIWIQTGFAMVILSAAIKAVPSELIEAARVDGATTSQTFWRVVLPQIATTIGVVVTTLIVLVMKVFDIVKVVTNGQFGTQVLANNMFQEAFTNTNRGKGAALAVILFVSVLPVMILNIRRMQREA